MPTTLLKATVGGGKTEAVLHEIFQTVHNLKTPFASVWTLLATRRQEDNFRARLAHLQSPNQVFFNIEIFHFYDLYTRLLDLAGQPQRHLDTVSRYSMLYDLLESLKPQLQYFQSIALTSGFIQAVADLIDELKQNSVLPEDFARAAHTLKDQDLALIYSAYQNMLVEHHLVDKEGQGWLALDLLKQDERLASDVQMLVVDGYDIFTPVQAELIALLSQRIPQTIVTLTHVPHQEGTIGRRFTLAENRLREFHERHNVDLDVRALELPYDNRHVDLQQMTTAIASGNTRVIPTAKAHNEGINLIEASGLDLEVSAVLRRVKHFLLNGASPDELVIVLREWEHYLPYLLNDARRYGVPLALHYGEPLRQTPPMIALMNLLELEERDFERELLLDLLRSPYFEIPDIGPDEIALLDRISQEYTVLSGRDAWLEAIQLAATPLEERDWDVEIDWDDEDRRMPWLVIDESVGDRLYIALSDFFVNVVPKQEASFSGYITWLEKLIGPDSELEVDEDEITPHEIYTLNMIKTIRRLDDSQTMARDLLAIRQLADIFRSLYKADVLLQSLGLRGETSHWSRFKSMLLALIDTASIESAPIRTGRVLVTTAANARGLPHAHVFILGLSEGLFPKAPPEDPFYLDSERRALEQQGIPLLTIEERATDDGLFYELISLAQQSLTLSRPTQQGGSLWIESHLWRQVTEVFAVPFDEPRKQIYKAGQVVPINEVSAVDELLITLSDSLTEGARFTGVKDVYNWLCHQDDLRALWEHIVHNHHVEIDRSSYVHPYGPYSGRLSQADLIAEIGRLLDETRYWSASQLRELGECGFRFFAKRLLRLEAIEPPEEGMDVLQTGLVFHDILEHTYKRIQEEALAISPENQEIALEILQEVIDERLPQAPERYRFTPTPLWEHEQKRIKQLLEALVSNDFSAESVITKTFNVSKREPYQQEAAFGEDIPVTLELDDMILRLRGFIDRIDMTEAGALVIDYKSGRSKISKRELEEGRNFQLLVYLEAIRTLLAEEDDERGILGAAFWHIPGHALGSPLHIHKDIEAINRAKTILRRHVEHAQRGDFRVHPNRPNKTKCSQYCEFFRLCRVSTTAQYKQGDG